ncbi:MAG: sulfite exporter TauE/SafE family protein [Gammaproteobacteria bacterium]|nr:sulfite exporter TauE/SafE family protein [Gammaproteobacteria bacterium]
MLETWVILSYLCLGAFVGFFAGLLGIGGGGIIVPVLTSLFLAQQFPFESVVHLALASSMTSIIFTSISSIRSHHQHAAIIWPIVFKISPGIALGTFSIAYLVAFIPTKPLAIIFAIFMAFISIQMLLNKKPKPSRDIPRPIILSLVGAFIGAISALVAIGGGSLSVPFMTWCNVNLKNAIATSSAIGFPIALMGALGYWVGGTQQSNLPEFSSGFIYWPAVLLISSVSVLTAPLGVKMAHKLPVLLLKRIFAALLMALSIKMLTSI